MEKQIKKVGKAAVKLHRELHDTKHMKKEVKKEAACAKKGSKK